MQEQAWFYSIFLMGLIGLGGVYVALHSGHREVQYAPLAQKAYRWRSRLFWLLVIVFFPAMIYNLWGLPYEARADNGAVPVQIISAVGHMWSWDIEKKTIKAGQPVDIRVTSADVNHGFGIYDEDMHLLAQTQAMPGYVNTIHYVFKKPGTYRVLCMEYCGVAHAAMMSEIKVDP